MNGVTIDRFEKNGSFRCPVCGFKISSRRKTTTQYVIECGEHYKKCAKSISKERLHAILEKFP
jgi:predicted RNA-binding Zn-ribbon protein involved in translation (DUF1610 family)